MPHSWGYRARTRHLFAKDFRRHGLPSISKYLVNYKLGDYVDIKADGAVHKGMPHKYYHGKTGVVWNVTKRAIGVEINKRVRTRILRKRIHVRVEHLKISKCCEDHKRRVQENDKKRREAKAKGIRLPPGSLKRLPAQPRPGKIVKKGKRPIETVFPLKYELVI
eukprot:TRINITY_DN182_c0_g1_i1.p1 TRINITY_DN182_c0_g1~~TRINITY_DN182_c0_g1_i1.p1  ORF type:complete len:164 (-),score=24.04 TRINITY_DN182_c0_g1_i1:148-639(-)